MPVDEIQLELAARMPWLHAQPGTWWIVDGRANLFGRAGLIVGFMDLVAEAVTGDDDEGVDFTVPHFRLVGYSCLVPATDITRARELILVRADDPLTALNDDDQPAIDAALARRDEETR